MPTSSFAEITEFLTRFAPRRAAALEHQFPEEAYLLQGRTAGAVSFSERGAVDPILFRLRASKEATFGVRESVQKALPALRNRLVKAKRLKLFLEIATALSGSVTAAATLTSAKWILAPSLLTVATAIATASRSSLLETFGGPSSTADGLYRELLEASAEADLLCTELSLAVETENEEDRGPQLVEQAGALARTATRLLGLAGL